MSKHAVRAYPIFRYLLIRILLGLWLPRTSCTASPAALINASSHRSIGGNADCISGIIDISVTAQNLGILYEGPANSFDATQLLLKLAHRNTSLVSSLVGGRITIEAVYRIYTKLCTPVPHNRAKRLKSVQLLSHGGTLDHNYWDVASGYSYVDAAAEAGYATLSYDRLGIGLSDHPDPINVVQSAVHVEVVHALAALLRHDGIGHHSFEKVIGVGHSIGAWFTHGAAAKYPEDMEAIILTGVSGYPDHLITSLDSSGRFNELPNGYLAPAPLISIHQYNFYDYPHFEKSGESKAGVRGCCNIIFMWTKC